MLNNIEKDKNIIAIRMGKWLERNELKHKIRKELKQKGGYE